MQPYLRPPWTDPHQIWTVDVLHHAPPIHGIQNAEMQKKFFFDFITSVLYTVYGEVGTILLCIIMKSSRAIKSGRHKLKIQDGRRAMALHWALGKNCFLIVLWSEVTKLAHIFFLIYALRMGKTASDIQLIVHMQ